jgi:predicted O-methyltransferase YrrM
VVHTIEPNHIFAYIAHQIHQHAGLANRIVIHLGILQNLEEFVKEHGQFDFILIDHETENYLKDFKELERLGAIRQTTTIFADNIISPPGTPDYHEFMRHNAYYDSTLYYSYNAYSNTQDAVIVSLRVTE